MAEQEKQEVIEISSVDDDDEAAEEDEAGWPSMEGTQTDDEQEDKEIEAVPSTLPGDPPGELELWIQDLKTEDPSQPGGYARRRVGRGSVVLVRGQDDEGTTVTWVAMVKKVYRRGPQYRADICWLYRKSDVPSAAARNVTLSSNPRQLLFTNDADKVDAKFIRHPAHAWFLTEHDPVPTMRCGQGQLRHSRPRPGFLVRHVYDKQSGRVYALGDSNLKAANPELGREVRQLVQASRDLLREVQLQEARYDLREGLAAVEAMPFVRPEAAAARQRQLAEEEEAATAVQEDSSAESESEEEQEEQERRERGCEAANGINAGPVSGSCNGAVQGCVDEAQQKQQQQQEEEQRRLQQQQQQVEDERRPAEAQQRRQQEVDAEAVKLARLLPQQQQEQDKGGDTMAPVGAQPVGQQGQEPGSPTAPVASPHATSASAASWKRCAQQLLRQAGELPKKAAPPPTAGPQSGQCGRPAGGLTPEQVDQLAEGATQPGTQHLVPLLQAICGATESAARELLDQLMFLRVLITWLWNLVAVLAQAAEVPHQALDPEVERCAVLVLRALERCPYTAAADRWLRMVYGDQMLRMLTDSRDNNPYPPAVQQAAARLKGLWRESHEELRRQHQERQRQRDANERRERQQEREEQRMLQRSPQAAKVVGMATSGRRVSALGVGGGATYVRPRLSPQPMGSATPATSCMSAATRVAAGGQPRTAPPGMPQITPIQPPAAASAADGLQQRALMPPTLTQSQPAAQQSAAAGDAAGVRGCQPAAAAASSRPSLQAAHPATPHPQQTLQHQQQQADPLSAAWLSAFGGKSQSAPPKAQQPQRVQQQQQPQRVQQGQQEPPQDVLWQQQQQVQCEGPTHQQEHSQQPSQELQQPAGPSQQQQQPQQPLQQQQPAQQQQQPDQPSQQQEQPQQPPQQQHVCISKTVRDSIREPAQAASAPDVVSAAGDQPHEQPLARSTLVLEGQQGAAGIIGQKRPAPDSDSADPRAVRAEKRTARQESEAQSNKPSKHNKPRKLAALLKMSSRRY